MSTRSTSWLAAVDCPALSRLRWPSRRKIDCLSFAQLRIKTLQTFHRAVATRRKLQKKPRWLTRTEAAKRLDTTIAGIRRLEGKTLFPETIAGIERFRPSEIAAILESQSPLSKPVSPKPGRPRWRNFGEEAAAVFALFAEGKGLREIVTSLRVCPERVRTLYHHWITDLETGERLRPPKHPEPPPAHSRRRVPASAALRGQSSSPPKSLDARPVASTDDQLTDLAASSNAVTALLEKLLGNH